MPYIPRLSEYSMQEMAYAPTLIRQQEDDAVTKQMELTDALKFDYLKQDASNLEPVLQKYNDDISKVSTDLAKNGFTQDTKSKILGLRQQYIGDDKIRHTKKRYSDAMTGWDEQRKRMIQEGRPGSDIENQKAAYFSDQTPAYSKDGYKNDFVAGATSGYHDIAEETKKAMTGIGQNGKIVGTDYTVVGTGTHINPNTGKEEGLYSFTDNKSGQKLTNLTQIEAVAAYMNKKYDTQGTDENRFAQINKIDSDYRKNIINGVATSMTSDLYHQLPSSDTRYQFAPDGSDKTQQPGLPFSRFTETDVDPKITSQAHDDLSILDTQTPSGLSPTEIGSSKAYTARRVDPYSTQQVIPTKEEYDKDLGEALQKKQTDIAKDKQKVINNAKTEYPDYFTPGVDEISATKRAIATKINNAANINQYTGIDLSEKEFPGGITKYIIDKRIKPDYQGDLFKKQDKDTGWFSRNAKQNVPAYKSLFKKEEDWQKATPSVDKNGDIRVQDPNGKWLTIEPKAFDDDTQELQSNVLKPLLSQLNDHTIFNNPSKHPIPVPGMNLYFDVHVRAKNPNDPNDNPDKHNLADRTVWMYSIDPKTHQPINAREMTPPEAKNELVRGIFSGFKDTTTN